jgi:hypothetical protein
MIGPWMGHDHNVVWFAPVVVPIELPQMPPGRGTTVTAEDTQQADDKDASAGYQAAVNIYINEANRIWARFQAMLAVCTLLITISGSLLLNPHLNDAATHLRWLAPGAGAVMSV